MEALFADAIFGLGRSGKRTDWSTGSMPSQEMNKLLNFFDSGLVSAFRAPTALLFSPQERQLSKAEANYAAGRSGAELQ
jgi:hypothetical protein